MAQVLGEQTVQTLRTAIDEAVSEIGDVPASAHAALTELVDVLERHGNAVIFPIEATVSTQQAAALLGVSRMTVVRLIDRGKMTADVAGVHRRISVSELDRYRRESASARRAALDQLVAGVDGDALPDEPVTTR